MSIAYIFIIGCLPFFVLNSFCDKYISALHKPEYNRIYNIIKYILASVMVIPFLLMDKAPIFGFGAIACGLGCGICYVINKTAILIGYEKSSVAFMTLFHTAGMIVPCVLGAIFWNEPLTLFAAIGVVIVIASIMLLKTPAKTESAKSNSKGSLFYGILVFIASGGTMVCQKLIGTTFLGESVSAYNFYAFLSAAIIFALIPQKGHKFYEKMPAKANWASFGCAVAQFTISMVMTDLAKTVPSVILFPMFNGIGIILVTLMSAVIFKEKITLRTALGVLLGIGGLMLIKIG